MKSDPGLEFLAAGIAVFSLQRFDDQPIPDGFRRNFDFLRRSINDGVDGLDIGFKCPFGGAGDLEADAAQIFGLTSITNFAASSGTGAGKMADTGHGRVSGGGPEDQYKVES